MKLDICRYCPIIPSMLTCNGQERAAAAKAASQLSIGLAAEISMTQGHWNCMLLLSSAGPCLDGGSWRGSHFSRGCWQAQDCKLHARQPSCSPCLLHSMMDSARGCAPKKRARSWAQLWPWSLLSWLQIQNPSGSAQSISCGCVLPFLLPAGHPMCVGAAACGDRSTVISCSHSSTLVHMEPVCLSDTSITAGEEQLFDAGPAALPGRGCPGRQLGPGSLAGATLGARCHSAAAHAWPDHPARAQSQAGLPPRQLVPAADVVSCGVLKRAKGKN